MGETSNAYRGSGLRDNVLRNLGHVWELGAFLIWVIAGDDFFAGNARGGQEFQGISQGCHLRSGTRGTLSIALLTIPKSKYQQQYKKKRYQNPTLGHRAIASLVPTMIAKGCEINDKSSRSIIAFKEVRALAMRVSICCAPSRR